LQSRTSSGSASFVQDAVGYITVNGVLLQRPITEADIEREMKQRRTH
jgi:hypothetical protein